MLAGAFEHCWSIQASLTFPRLGHGGRVLAPGLTQVAWLPTGDVIIGSIGNASRRRSLWE